MAERHERKTLNYACLAHVVREGGFFIIFVIRLSAIPGHFSSAYMILCITFYVAVPHIISSLAHAYSQSVGVGCGAVLTPSCGICNVRDQLLDLRPRHHLDNA
jgi:hypothetical protein